MLQKNKVVLLAAFALIILSAALSWIFQGGTASNDVKPDPQRLERQDRDLHERIRNQRFSESRSQPGNNTEATPLTPEAFAAAVSRAEQWPDKSLLFTKALAGGAVPLEVLWEVFQSLEDDSSGGFGLASIGPGLFRGFATRNPGYGIECLDTLPPGLLRTRSLLAFASSLPASHVADLHRVLVAAGFKEDLRVFNSAVSGAPHGLEDLRYLVGLGIFDGRAQESLEKRLRRYEAEVSLQSGGIGGDAASKLAESAPAEQPAPSRFDRRYFEDRFGAAEEVQAGAFPEIANDRQRVRELAKGLASQSAPAALEWALAWRNEPTRLTSVAAVVESWVQLDPMACSKHVGNITDQQARDVAAGQLAIYLTRMGSTEEAKAWLDSIQSKQVRSDTEALIVE